MGDRRQLRHRGVRRPARAGADDRGADCSDDWLGPAARLGSPPMASTPATDRLRALFDATVAFTSELALDSLLQKLVETAAAVTGARYAALGVIDESGSGLERFVTT